MVLGKYTGSEDVVLGIPTNTRPDGAEQVIGMFVNTAPVRVRPARGLDISGYLTAVSEAVRSATRGSSLPFEDVVAEFAKARDASRSPIFDVTVNYLWEPAVYAADGLTLSMYVPLQRMGRDIGFTMRRQVDRLLFMTQYSSALFEEDVIRNMIAQIWETIGLLEKGSVRTVREALALPKAQEERLAAFSRTAEAEVPVTLLHQLFEKAAEENAERTALIAKDGTLTYRKLNESANIVAHNLIARGIAVGDSVALLLPRESSFFRCLFGVNKAGAAFIPCDPKYPVERIRTILEDSGASLLITTADRLGEYPEGKAVDVAELLSGDKAENPNLPMSGDELAYMIYTSGSTGKPKGVMLRHAGICNYLQPHPANVHMAFVREFVETYLSVTTVSFDMSFKEHTAALCNGKTLLFASDEAGNDPQELARLMRAHGVDCLNATPSRLQQYLFSGAFCEALKNCKCVMSGGEGYPLSLRDQIREIAPNVRIFNTYGPTEITVSCNGVDLTNAPCVTVGRPLLNYHEYIVDKFGDLAPYGVEGELYVGGVGVAKGYRNLPEKTAEAFVEYKGERMYRTGDLAKFDGDGNVMILGRLDSQVKIRGLRIELGEVESVIREFPGVRDVTVQAFTPPAGGKALAAYIVSDSPVDEKALAAFIAKTKPSYMVPEAVVQLDRIPLNQNQKVDRRALPTPEVRKAAPANAVAPRPLTRFEEEIAAVVKKAVGDVAIAPTEDLTSLGLTSVGAIGLATMLAERFQTEIPVNELLGGLSLVDLENRIFEEWMNRGFMPAGEAKKAGPAVPETEKRDAYPLSFVQQAVYYDLMKRENAGTIYNIPHCLAFAEIDAARLANAVKAAVRAHSYLNTHFEIRDGAIVQVRDDAREVDVPVLQMEELSFAAYKEAFVRPFDTGVGPLYRFAVVVVDDGKTYLFMDIHHLVFDGFSRGVFLRDVGRAYRGEELLPEAYSYFDYAKEEADRQGTAAYKEDEAYFEELMQRFEVPSEVPADKSGMEENGKQADSVRLVPKELADGLSRKLGITPASLFLAASFYTVSRFAGTREVYISTIDTGRNLPKTHKAVGMFVHTLPLAMSFEKDQTVRELAAASEKALRGSVLHEGYPFAELAAKYGYTNQIMYECQIGMLSGEGSLGGVPFEDVPLGLEKPKFKISLSIVELDGSYGIYVRYNDAIYQKETMDALAEALGICIEHMAKDPEQSVRKLSLLGKEEAEVIASFGKAETAELPETVFHRVFEARVRENPDATALIACDKTLTFAELNGEANRVATSLMEMGVGKGGSCVLLLPRRSFYFAAMFGVLKAGAAFIPCDPEYPPERIRHIVHDADASCIITTEEHLPDYAGETVVDIQQLLLGEDRGNPDVPLTGEDMAYMIYTSGSTGRPKGVMMKHVCVVNCVYPHPVNEHYYVIKNEAKAVLGVTTVSFDMSFQETAGSLLNGKTLVFASEEELNDPRALTALFEQTGADVFDATPSRYLQYMEYEPFKKALGRCRLVMVGGEGFPQTLLEKLQAVLSPDAHIENAYGPTETTMACNGADLIKAPRVAAGPPLLNYESYIVDLDGNPVPRRVIGELLIGGIGVGIGYRNLPEMTEKRFIMYEGRRVYRSGDYARWDMDGNVEVLGRMDNQVKLRGQRIELGEIEGLMEAQPDIRRAVVAIRKIHGQDNLCAWFTADREIDVYELREELKKKLTAYMVPVAFAQLEKMPQTPNGKTDMKALPTPKAVELGEFVAPANAVEQFFCDLFKDILGMEKVGATDDFFSFGGTSLTATTVMIKATEAGYKLTYGDVFKYKTPRELASRFVRGEEKKEETTSVTAKTFDNYDYTAINALLAKNTIASFNGGEPRPIGNILLTGATGYMGAHLLAEYLRTETGTAYCLVRKGRYGTAIERLRYLLFYYFDQEFANVGGRVVAFDGDVTDYACFAALKDLPIDTVFNCAANVKHFSSGTDIEDINVGGAKNCVRFAEETGTRLIHFSTTSVGGAMLVSDPSQLRNLDEQSLYFGQLVENQYTSSKLLSERIALEGVAERGVDAKVIRVGALSARASDGEFQINVLSNSAMGRLRSHVLLKCFPYTFMNLPFRMGPIDTSAKSFLHLARTPRECCLFHAINNHTVPYIDIIRVMREAGMEIAIVEEAIFLRALREAEADPEKAAILSSILAYTGRLKEAAVLVQETCEYTNQILARCGFYWDETDMAYIRRFIDGLKGLGFFDTDNLYR